MATSEESNINSQPTADEAGKTQSAAHDEKGRFLPGVIQPGAKPFKPGETGNPRGGSAKQRMTCALLQAMSKKDGIDEALANVVLSRGLKGDIRFIELIFDRIDGKILEKAEVNLVGAAAAMTPEQALAAIEEAYHKRHASNRQGKEKNHRDKAR
jgi:hypothetical protein